MPAERRGDEPFDHVPASLSAPASSRACERSPQGTFAWCPMCDGRLEPEHAHYRCVQCGWRDSCCD